MPSYKQKDRLVPYKILVYLLCAPEEEYPWLERLNATTVRVFTGPASRAFRMKNDRFLGALRWLRDSCLVKSINNDDKKGVWIIELRDFIKDREEDI